MTPLQRSLTAAVALCALLLCAGAGARGPAERRFITAPKDNSVFLVDSLTRLDMLDYFRAGNATPSANVGGGPSQLLAVDSMQIVVTTGKGTLQRLRLLPGAKGDTVILVVSTFPLATPVATVRLYDDQWQPLPDDRLPRPRLADWLRDGKRRAEAERLLPFVAYGADYDPATATLTLTHSMDTYYADPDERALAAALLRPALTYRWDGKRFK